MRELRVRTGAETHRLACDAAIIPILLGSDSMSLDVGHQQRLVTAVLHDPLGQTRPRCSSPACRLCEHHHVIVHRQGRHIRLDGIGQPVIPLRGGPARARICGRAGPVRGGRSGRRWTGMAVTSMDAATGRSVPTPHSRYPV